MSTFIVRNPAPLDFYLQGLPLAKNYVGQRETVYESFDKTWLIFNETVLLCLDRAEHIWIKLEIRKVGGFLIVEVIAFGRIAWSVGDFVREIARSGNAFGQIFAFVGLGLDHENPGAGVFLMFLYLLLGRDYVGLDWRVVFGNLSCLSQELNGGGVHVRIEDWIIL